MSGEMWGFIFLMVALKLPILYLGAVVWYACKPPLPPEEEVKVGAASPSPNHDLWRPWRSRRASPRPHGGGPGRRAPRTSSAARAYARHE